MKMYTIFSYTGRKIKLREWHICSSGVYDTLLEGSSSSFFIATGARSTNKPAIVSARLIEHMLKLLAFFVKDLSGHIWVHNI